MEAESGADSLEHAAQVLALGGQAQPGLAGALDERPGLRVGGQGRQPGGGMPEHVHQGAVPAVGRDGRPDRQEVAAGGGTVTRGRQGGRQPDARPIRLGSQVPALEQVEGIPDLGKGGRTLPSAREGSHFQEKAGPIRDWNPQPGSSGGPAAARSGLRGTCPAGAPGARHQQEIIHQELVAHLLGKPGSLGIGLVSGADRRDRKEYRPGWPSAGLPASAGCPGGRNPGLPPGSARQLRNHPAYNTGRTGCSAWWPARRGCSRASIPPAHPGSNLRRHPTCR